MLKSPRQIRLWPHSAASFAQPASHCAIAVSSPTLSVGCLPVDDVQGDEDERLAGRGEADRVGRSGELAGERCGRHARIVVGHDELAREPGRCHPTRVEQERHPLVVAGLSLRHVGEGEAPVGTERLQQVAERAQVAAHLLDCDDVEP